MDTDFNNVRQLEHRPIQEGERWLYVADFNVSYDDERIKNTDRIDIELDDLRQISEAGGIALILAHKGRFKDRGADELDFVAPYLSKRIGRKVRYFEENSTDAALDFVAGLKPGEIAIMGNTRKNKGEEKNDPALAKQFSRLGEYVAVGGFGKAHRRNASNVGILEYHPGYATRSQLSEMRLLAPWTGKEAFSVAVLGGVKKEKITVGLTGLVEIYDGIIPGGIVLNTILKVKGYEIGDSVISDKGRTFEKEVKDILNRSEASKVYTPTRVLIAKKTGEGYQDIDLISLEKREVPKDYKIVSYKLPEAAKEALERVVDAEGRLVLAGTPDLYKEGLGLATAEVVEVLKRPEVRGLVLGGDTAAEIDYMGTKSTGGGSALTFLATGTTDVFEALKRNKKRFSDID